jgi:hypothetical protein
MTGLPQNVHDLLARLSESSRNELDLVRELATAIQRADDQLLKEVRSVSMLHEIRREAIVSELQQLASRLCALPVRMPVREPLPAIEQAASDADDDPVTVEPPATGGAGDWREAAQRIDAELQQYFNGAGPRH